MIGMINQYSTHTSAQSLSQPCSKNYSLNTFMFRAIHQPRATNNNTSCHVVYLRHTCALSHTSTEQNMHINRVQSRLSFHTHPPSDHWIVNSFMAGCTVRSLSEPGAASPWWANRRNHTGTRLSWGTLGGKGQGSGLTGVHVFTVPRNVCIRHSSTLTICLSSF